MTDNTSTNNIPSWFKTFSIVSLVWNLMGIMAFIAQLSMSAKAIASLPQAEQALYANTPLWAIIAFAFAVFGGAFGCIALLMKNYLAVLLFTLSLIGLGVQMFHSFVVINSFEVFGPSGLIMPILVTVWALVLLVIAKKAKSEHWFNSLSR